ncbi:MAG: LptF/LptG family permease, partial [Muribaculaceae bacterium]|nr:LptF/LptG family permease [Muribaculaceae bacterium]
NGMDNSRVILADSGKFSFTEDKTRLFLHLYNGEMFENLRDNSMGTTSKRYMPFRRENFTDKQIYFAFDANFNRMDEGGMRSQYIGQNISQLRHSIDSIGQQVDSVGHIYAEELRSQSVLGIGTGRHMYGHSASGPARPSRRHAVRAEEIDVDSVFNAPTPAMGKTYITQALNSARRHRQEYEFKSVSLSDQARLMRRHDIEMQKKFTLSFACIIFFFIGAPLGAIIKKGGLGTPLVVSVLLFIFYFIIDNAGYKMARDGKVAVWEGIWLSSIVLLPLGVFFTYKAVGDSAVFNTDAYMNLLRRLTGRELPRSLEPKEMVMNDIEPARALDMLHDFERRAGEVAAAVKRNPLARLPFSRKTAALDPAMNALVEYLSDTRDKHLVALLNRYPFRATPRRLDGIIDTTGALIQYFSNNGTENKA